VREGRIPLAVQKQDIVNTAEDMSSSVDPSVQADPTAAVISTKTVDHSDWQKQEASVHPKFSGLSAPPAIPLIAQRRRTL
jgi:hypothetical protein